MGVGVIKDDEEFLFKKKQQEEIFMKSKAFLVVIILMISAFPISTVSSSEIPDYAPTISELNAVGINVENVGQNLGGGVTFTGVSWANNPNEPTMNPLTVAIFEYENSEKAKERFNNRANNLKSLCSENRETADYVEEAKTASSYMCYFFTTNSITVNGNSYKYSASADYYATYMYGRYLIDVDMHGRWSDDSMDSYIEYVCSKQLVESGYAKCDVVVESDDPNYFATRVNEVKYQEYLKLLEKRKEASKTKAEKLTAEVVKLILKHTGITPTETTPTLKEKKYSLHITSPSDGETFTSSSGIGVFAVEVAAKVLGDGAKNLRAVIIASGGTRDKVSVSERGDIWDVLFIENNGSGSGTIKVELYGTLNSSEVLLASDSVTVTFANREEVPGDYIDNDGDGLVDCDDPDLFTCKACIVQKKLELAESIMQRHINYLKKAMELHPEYKSLYGNYISGLKEIHNTYINDPDKMIVRMNEYMEKRVYANQKINSYISIFRDDPKKAYQLRQIAIKYRYDPINRDIEMEKFIYENSKSEAEKMATINMIMTGLLNPPKWLVGGQYGSGGALDWAKFAADNFEKTREGLRIKGGGKVKVFTTGAQIYFVALDAKALMDHARDLEKMNLDKNAKVSIIVLDGTTKIGKILDPTGYFGNMADATVGALINLWKKIEERNQGWFTWNGYVLHETTIPGIYEDYETGKKFRRVGGGWFSREQFVEVKENG